MIRVLLNESFSLTEMICLIPIYAAFLADVQECFLVCAIARLQWGLR